MKRIIAIMFMLILLVPTVCLAADAWVVNHVMADKIEITSVAGCLVKGSTSAQFEIPAGHLVARHQFSTLDQLLFQAGTFKVEQRIVEDATGQIVAAFKPNSIQVKNNQEIRHFNIAWDFAARAGMYTYQVFVDDQLIGAFKISILAGK